MARVNRSLVDSILNEIRLVCGEENEDGAISNELLLLLLNRAQDEAAQLLARHYVEPILTYVDMPVTASPDYELPEDCFEGRAVRVEFRTSANESFDPLERRDFASDEASALSGEANASQPLIWLQIGLNNIRVLPYPSTAGTIRIWYAKQPTDLVLSQGRIKSVINTTTIELDMIGEEITSDLGEDGSHLCIIDGQIGDVKAILEVSSVSTSTNTVSFSLAPITAQIEGVPVEVCPDLTAEDYAGDYVCLAPFTCIPIIRQPVLNYIKQYAIALVQNNLGASHEVAYAALKEMSKFVQSMDTAKPSHKQVRMKSDAYGGNVVRRNWPRPRS